MKILITGAGGQLANAYKEIDKDNELILLNRSQLDITNLHEVEQAISNAHPDVVFHFASMTRRLECADNPDLARKINVTGTINVANVCKKYNTTLLFISSNEVFSGKTKNFYYDGSLPNAVTTVGKNKQEAETYIKANLKKYFIVRTSWLYSKWTNNFLQTILKIGKQNGHVKVVTDEVSSPTYSLDLASAIFKLVKTKKYGTYNISNRGKASRYQFAKKVFEFYNIDNVKVAKTTLSEFDAKELPPTYTPLASRKLAKIGINMRKWDVALSDFLKTKKP